MTQNVRTLHLTRRELELLLRHAYPFEQEAARLRTSAAQDGWHIIQLDPYWLSHWIGDLVHSAKKVRSEALRAELEALCCVLENAEHVRAHMRRAPLE